MPVEFHYNDAGTWRKLSEFYYNDAATWRELDGVWYNDNGTWRRVFDNRAVSLQNANATGNRNTISGLGVATAAYNLTSDGLARTRQNTTNITDSTTSTEIGDNWWTGKPQVAVGDDYEVRAVQVSTSGGGTFTGTLDTWQDISVQREWQLQDSCSNCEKTQSRTITVQIRDALTQTVQNSATITLTTNLFGP